MNLYNNDILKQAVRIEHTTQIDDFHIHIHRRSRVCGSHLEIWAGLEGGMIERFSWSLSLCALGQAVAGLLSPHIPGMTRKDLDHLFELLSDFLDGRAEKLPETFADFECLSVLRDHPHRRDSAFLPLEGLIAVFEKAA